MLCPKSNYLLAWVYSFPLIQAKCICLMTQAKPKARSTKSLGPGYRKEPAYKSRRFPLKLFSFSNLRTIVFQEDNYYPWCSWHHPQLTRGPAHGNISWAVLWWIVLVLTSSALILILCDIECCAQDSEKKRASEKQKPKKKYVPIKKKTSVKIDYWSEENCSEHSLSIFFSYDSGRIKFLNRKLSGLYSLLDP